MLYLAYPAPHTPWLPAPEFNGSSKASMYGDFSVMVDQAWNQSQQNGLDELIGAGQKRIAQDGLQRGAHADSDAELHGAEHLEVFMKPTTLLST